MSTIWEIAQSRQNSRFSLGGSVGCIIYTHGCGRPQGEVTVTVLPPSYAKMQLEIILFSQVSVQSLCEYCIHPTILTVRWRLMLTPKNTSITLTYVFVDLSDPAVPLEKFRNARRSCGDLSGNRIHRLAGIVLSETGALQ